MRGKWSRDKSYDSHDMKEPKEEQKKKRVARIEVDRDLCIGAATCLALAPDAFTLDDEGKAVVKKEALQYTDEELIAAAASCPTKAIFLYDEDGNHIMSS